MTNLGLQLEHVGSPRDHLIDGFTTTYSQVYAANLLRRRYGKNCHECPDRVIDVHCIDVIFPVSYHGEVRIALKGEAADKFRVKLAWWLIRAIRTEEANNSCAP